MFTKTIFFLLPLAVTCQIISLDDGERRFRQADLNYRSQETRAIDNEFADARQINNEYLPPVSSTPPPIIRIATQQSEKNLINEDTKRTNFLAPPFNEIDRQRLPLPSNNVIRVNNAKPLPASKLITEPQKAQNEFLLLNGVAPVESRNYLPPQPEYSAAAQTPQGQSVAIPPRQEEHHHHHHHHHHDENFDICSDAFHSFLCTPLKARKRITGAFPERLRGQASFNQYQKVLPDQYLSPLNNQYLPPNEIKREPIRYSAPSNRIESTNFAPRTTQTPRTFPTTKITLKTIPTVRTTTARITAPPPPSPRVIPATSNVDDRFYLPPLPERSNELFSRNPQPSNTVENTVKLQPPFQNTPAIPKQEVDTLNGFRQSDLTRTNKDFPSSVPTQKPIVSTPIASTLNNIKPTQKANPSGSFGAAKQTFQQTTTTFGSQPTNGVNYFSSSKLSNPSIFPRPQSTVIFQNSPFVNSPSPTVVASTYSSPIPTQTFTTIEPQGIPIFNQNQFGSSGTTLFSPASITPIEFQSTFSPKATILPSLNLITTTLKPFPKNTFLPSSSTILKTSDGGLDGEVRFSNVVPSSRMTSNIITTTAKSISPSKNGAIPNNAKQPQYIRQPNNNFLPPLIQEQRPVSPLPSTQPALDRTNLCNDPFNSFLCASTNSGKITPPARNVPGKIESQASPLPSFQNNVISKSQEVLQNADNLSSQPSSVTVLSSESPVKEGYNYPQPEKVFPLPSQQKVTMSPTTTKIITTQKVGPTELAASATQAATGYSYLKPEPAFPLPSEIIETADTGYSYPRPAKEFSLPAAQNLPTEAVVLPSSTTLAPSTTRAPSSTTPSPSTPSPTTPIPVISSSTIVSTTIRAAPTTVSSTTAAPTTAEPTTAAPTTPAPTTAAPTTAASATVTSTTPVPTTIVSTTLTPSSTPFKLSSSPSTPVPSTTVRAAANNEGYFYQRPAQSFNLPQRPQGYNYPKPENRLRLPNERGYQPLFSEALTSRTLDTSGSALFIPVNKLEKRSDASRIRRFGERIRKLERKSFN